MKGLLLIAHGSKLAEANADFLKLAGEAQARLAPMAVEGAFLELASPSIPDAIDRLIARGAAQIAALPYFLSHGKHTTLHIPEIIEGKMKEHPDVSVTLHPPVGALPEMLDLILRMARG